MGPTLVLHAAIDVARRSWRGQVVVLASGTVLFALVVLGGTGGALLVPRMLVAWLLAAALLAASVSFADEPLEAFDLDEVRGRLLAVGALMPTVLAQLVVAASPMVGVVLLTGLVASVVPLLALPLVPLAFLVNVLSAGPMALAVVAVVRGDEAKVPRIAWATAKRHRWALPLTMLVCGTVAALAAAPVALTGMVFGMVFGFAAPLGFGLAVTAVLPCTGCLALAAWEASGAEVDAFIADAYAAGEGPVPAATAPTSWVAGPTWNAVLEPGGTWGAWLSVGTTPDVSIAVNWNGGVEAPAVALGTPEGAWTQLGVLPAPGGAVTGQAVPGSQVYVQLTSTSSQSQGIAVAAYVAGAAAA